jgi:hypothetical protein
VTLRHVHTSGRFTASPAQLAGALDLYTGMLSEGGFVVPAQPGFDHKSVLTVLGDTPHLGQ